MSEPIDEHMSLVDVPRNDLDAAERYYRAHEPITSEEWRALHRLQDRPARFEARSRQWRVVESGA